jgi:hypothetical protein
VSAGGGSRAPVEAALGALAAALDEERAAVARLDGQALERLREHKERLAAELRALRPGEQLRGRGDPLAVLAARVLAQARANELLLADAVQAIGERLGLRPQPGTYDARARMKQQLRTLIGKAA